MKKLLTFFLAFACFAHSKAAVIYVGNGGNDGSGLGTIGFPYASVARANSAANTGDIIHVMAGTYKEASQISIKPGVSVEGEGVSTHVLLDFYQASYHSSAIFMSSTVENTNGNQSISNMWLDGDNFTSFIGVLVRCRSNVSIHDCTFTNFQVSAVLFDGKSKGNTGVPPTIFSTGNSFYNNIVTNCNDRVLQAAASVSCGSLTLGGQQTMLIHDNTFTNTGKAQGHNGDLVGGIQGNTKDIKFYNNIMNKPRDEGNSFNCGAEIWFDNGGWEVYGNTYNGGGSAFDVGYGGGRKNSAYSYSWYFHDNTFQNATLLDSFPTYPLSVGSIAIEFETSTNATYGPFPITASGDIRIEHNHCNRIGRFVSLGLNNNIGDTLHRVYINNNLCENMGYTRSAFEGMLYFKITKGVLLDSVFIDNNTFSSNTGVGSSQGGLFLEHSTGTISNIYLRNNIIQNVVNGYGYLVFRGSVKCNNIFTQNNILFNNINSNNPKYFSGAPSPTTNFTNTGNLPGVDPKINSDFSLKSISPAIGAGLSLGYGTDIGAFQFKTITVPPSTLIHINHKNILH